MSEALPTLWFVLIAVLWAGYLFLEGFDLGVGMLMKLVYRTDSQRRVLLNTVGPVWDGNEVWLITAIGATFAAFPRGTRPCSHRSTFPSPPSCSD
jgi:cytochrome d ubiquinol oxidase subunit II